LAHLNLSQVLLRRQSSVSEPSHRRQLLDSAIAHCERAVEIYPDYGDAHSNLGNALTRRFADSMAGGQATVPSQLDSALYHCQRAVVLVPDSCEAHANLGNVYLVQNNLGKAIAEYKRALEINPDNVPVHDNLGSSLARSGDLPGAIEHYETALKKKSDDRIAREQLILVLMTAADGYAETGRFADAVAKARRALELAASQNNHALTEAIQAAIRHYEAGKLLKGPRSPVPKQ
jgi:tetratricopeptide (TPR) repeat protein